MAQPAPTACARRATGRDAWWIAERGYEGGAGGLVRPQRGIGRPSRIDRRLGELQPHLVTAACLVEKRLLFLREGHYGTAWKRRAKSSMLTASRSAQLVARHVT